MSGPESLHWARRQALERRAAASIRALARHPDVHFEAGRPWDGDRSLPDLSPHLQPQPGLESLLAYRGLADALAQRLRVSDDALHDRLQPKDDPVAALVFEWLEQWRAESLAPAHWPGMRSNIQARFEQWSALFLGSGQVENSVGMLLFCFAQVAWSRLTGAPIPDAWSDVIEAARIQLGPVLGQPLRQLFQLREDQAAYAAVAVDLARELSGWAQDFGFSQSRQTPRRARGFTIALPPSSSKGEEGGGALGGSSAQSPVAPSYSVWTRRYDAVEDASGLVRSALLLEYRRELDAMLADRSWPISRLARTIRHLLAQPHPEGWLFEQEEGHIDGRRLAQLISSPDRRAVFYQDRFTPVIRARVCLLIDCSGSMRHHGSQLALLMDVLGRAFDRAEVPFEALGFTTRTWNGGRPAREWSAGGRRAGTPGRLNELHHLVFRSPDMTRQERRLGVAAALKPDLYREGVDGEAVQWACARLRELGREGERRILWVISDGGPMDSATLQNNPPGLLDAHLSLAVREAGTLSGVEVTGVGVGQDLSAYYARSLPLDLAAGLDTHSLLSLIQTLRQP